MYVDDEDEVTQLDQDFMKEYIIAPQEGTPSMTDRYGDLSPRRR